MDKYFASKDKTAAKAKHEPRLLEWQLLSHKDSCDRPAEIKEYLKLLKKLSSKPWLTKVVEDILPSVNDGIVFVHEDENSCCFLFDEIRRWGISARLIAISTPYEDMKRTLKEFEDGEFLVLVINGSTIPQNFSVRGFNKIFLLTPIRQSSWAKQMIDTGMGAGKETPIIYDYADKTSVLRNSFTPQQEVYQQMECVSSLASSHSVGHQAVTAS